MSAQLSSFIQRTGKLPSLPSLYEELVRAVQNPDSSIDDISAVLRTDPSLVSRLLRLANSAFYGFSTEISTLGEAVQTIGLREIQDLVLATSVIQAFDRIPARFVDTISFWKHSIACGVASALLAEHCNEAVPERFFVGGLLHDIGRLILFLNAPEASRQILERCEREHQVSYVVEREILGFDHAMIGAHIVAYWRLPVSLRDMVECHHAPSQASRGGHDSFLVHYADFIASSLELGSAGETLICPLIVPPNCTRLLLTEEQIDPLVDDLSIRCEEIFPILTDAKQN